MSRTTRTLALPVVIALVATAVALSVSLRASRAADTGVSVTNFQFSPNDVSIEVGDTVTFSFNQGSHSVDFIGGPAATDSAIMSSGTFAFTPTQPGTYNFQCGVHGSLMTGVIDVAAQTGGSETPTNTATFTPTPATVTETVTTATNTPTHTPTPAITNTPTRTPTLVPTVTASNTPGSTTTPAGTVAATPIAPDTGEGTHGGAGGFPWAFVALGTLAVIALTGAGYAALSLRARA